MRSVGYIRVNPLEHNLDFQRDLLARRGVNTVFEDVEGPHGALARPQLTTALDTVRPGDTLVVWRLDRLGSSTTKVLSLLELLGKRGVGVASIAEDLDTSGPDGPALLDIIATFTELERTLVRERTMVGVYAARARGRVGGRPRALSATNVERVVMMREQGATVREIAEELGTSRATVYRVLDEVTAEDRPPAANGLVVRFAAPPDDVAQLNPGS